MDGRIFSLKNLINENLRKNWTIKEMARTAGISVPHLRKLFKRNLGVSPNAYVRDLRLDNARLYLETTFEQVHQVGIQDNSHFTRDFKKKYGFTPSDYRRKYWGGADGWSDPEG